MATKKSPAEERADAERREYSTFRAKQQIWHDGVIAYQPGHAVPVSNVEQYKYDEQGLVEKVTGEGRVQAEQISPFVGDGENPAAE